MKLIYKCDFCSENGSIIYIKQHEQECSFNPINKNCYSCIHLKNFKNDYDYCDLDLDCEEVKENNLKCDKHEQNSY